MSNLYLVLRNLKNEGLILDPIRRTPEMSAMHQDTSSDLKVVDEKLKSILEVQCVSVLVYGARWNAL